MFVLKIDKNNKEECDDSPIRNIPLLEAMDEVVS